jgi:DNA replication initiation complex subunit (GINS family)
MNYEDLRRYQRLERNSSKLSELNGSFYADLAQLISDCKNKCKETNSVEDIRIFENITKSARDIFERREQKLVMRAVRCARTKETDKDFLADEEKAFFERLSEELKKNRREFEMLLMGDSTRAAQKIQNINDIPAISNGQAAAASEDLNTVMVRILKKVPKFVSGDLKEYGPYEANSLAKLPKKEADLLSNRNFIEFV